MAGFGIITSPQVEAGFRNVDRKFFVPKGNESSAHSDEPLKEGNVHISAPHIYGSALEALELHPNSSLSFLNIGSGTGYVSCIVADILGPQSQNFGVDIHREVVEHCLESIARWKKARKGRVCGKRQSGSNSCTIDDCPTIEIIHGNGLNILSGVGESLIGFDRIYIGAAVDRGDLPNIKKLLSPGGILVGPVDGELVKIVRIGPIREMSRSNEADDDEMSDSKEDLNEFTQQVLSCVLFASLVKFPATEINIPARSWNPSTHRTFPNSFQKASMTLFLCSHAEYVQPSPRPKQPEGLLNVAATLPSDIWMQILTFTHRKWFEPQQTEVGFLKKRLLEEQANAAKAQKARLDAEALCHGAERERDIYRLLARRWQSRLQLIIQQRDARHESNTLTASNGDEGRTTLLGLGSAMLRDLHNDDDDDHDSQHQLAAEHNEVFLPGSDTTMQEVDAAENSEMGDGFSKAESEFKEQDSDDDEEEEYEFRSLYSDNGLYHDTSDSESVDDFQEDETENHSMTISESFELDTSSQQLTSSKPLIVDDRQQARTISFTSEDF